MSKSLYSFLIDIDVVSSLIPLFVLITTKSLTRQKLRRVLYYLAFVWAAAEIINWFFYRNAMNNILVVHIYDTLSTLGYYFFFHLVMPNRVTKKLFVIGSVLYVLIIWGSIIITNSYFDSLVISNILTFVVPLLLSVYTFYSIAGEAKIVNLLQEPIYWLNSAILIHFGFGLCANISLDFIIKSAELQMNIWPLVLISNVIHNIVFSIGVWKTNRV